jgi:hypothetical protein
MLNQMAGQEVAELLSPRTGAIAGSLPPQTRHATQSHQQFFAIIAAVQLNTVDHTLKES